MIRFLELLIALVLVAVAFVVVGLFLPSSRTIEHVAETNRPLRQVYDTLNSFRRAHDWHPLYAHDARLETRLVGEDRGVGARMEYRSRLPRLGQGAFEIVDSVQDSRIVMATENPRHGENKRHTITLDERGKTVRIHWRYDVDYGWNLLGRYAGLYIQRTAGDDIRIALGNVVGLLATMPNFDYKHLEINRVDVAPANVLYMTRNTDRNITAVENSMIEALATLRRAIRDSKLEEAGPPRLITTNFGSEKYEFDVAIPVRHPEGANVPVGEAVDADGNPLPIPLLQGLRLPDGVQQGIGYHGRALQAEFVGHPAALPLVRDMLRSYAAAHGEVIHDRAFEEYLTGIEDTTGEDAEFNVYWPVRTLAPGERPQVQLGPVPQQQQAPAPAADEAPMDGEGVEETPAEEQPVD